MQKLFGLSEQALQLAEMRADLIGGNIANSSTPGYKARDIDFQGALEGIRHQQESGSLMTDHSRHMQFSGVSSAEILYRVPMQTSQDGNTVDQEIERKNFLQNAVRYEVNLTLVHNRAKELLMAIKGE